MLITIGKAVKPWGLKGEMKIEPMTDFPERFSGLQSVHLVSPSGKELVCEVKAVRYAGGIPYLLFKGFDSPERAKTLNGWFIQVPGEAAVPLPEGTYYWHELIGMEVFSEADEKIGTIIDVFETGSNDVYVVKRGGKEVLLPATREVIKQIDRKTRRMVIHLMEGLLE